MRSTIAGLFLLLLSRVSPVSAQIFYEDPTTGFEQVESSLSEKGWAQLIVKLDMETYQPEGLLRGQADRAAQRSRIEELQASVIGTLNPVHVRLKRRYKLMPYLALEVTTTGLQSLRRNPRVSLITADVAGTPSASTPDPEEIRSAVLAPTAESGLIVGADVANANGCDGNGWAIAILDSGVQNDHPAFAGRVTHEACFSTHSPGLGQESMCPNLATDTTGVNTGDDCVPCRSRSGPSGGPYTYTPADCDFWPPVQVACPHGTLITGPAAGNGGGVVGIAPEAEIIAIRVHTRYTSECASPPWDLGCPLVNASDLMAAIEHVAELSETVNIAALNMSLDIQGTPGAPTSQISECDGIAYLNGIKDAVDLTNSYGIPATAASGNQDQRNRISPPACLSNVISVGYTQDGSSFFRNGTLYTTKVDSIGHEPNRADFLDFWAPGEWITSAWPNDPLETTRTERGTSLASPQVAAAFAALRSKGGARGIDYYRTLLESTGTMVTDNKISNPPKPLEPTLITKPRIDVGAACLAMSVVEVDIKVFLEGPYIGGGMMAPGAILLDSLPTKQPFGDPEYAGTVLEYESSDAVAAFPADVVDWVELELRTGNSAATAVAKRAALLLTDGSVVDFDGVSPVRFLGVDSVRYKVVVRHRNHGDIMSKGRLSTGDGKGNWDFTNRMDRAFGTEPMKQIGSVFVMFGGDSNIDAQVTVTDFNSWLTQTKALAEGYLSGDFNLDGQVTVSDFNIWLENTKAIRTSQVPN